MTDEWSYYRAALEASEAGRPMPGVNPNEPGHGFYFIKASREGGRIPVCIFRDKNGDLVCRSGTRDEHRFEDAATRWTWVAGNPVAREAYVAAWETGAWPDGTPTKAPELSAGSNLPTDPFERLKAEVDDKLESATTFVARMAQANATKVDADTARNIQAELLRFRKAADAMHKAEKQPHLDACKAVDDKYRFREMLDGWAGKLRNIFESFMKAEEAKARAEAERKFREEQAAAAAERARIEAERAKKLADDPIAALTDPEPEPLPELPLAPAPVKVNVGGGVGRAAGLKTVWVGEVIDYQATLMHYREHPDVKAAIDKIVKAAVRAGKSETKIPGVRVVEDRRAA